MFKLVKLVYRDVLEGLYAASDDGHILMKMPDGTITSVPEFSDSIGYRKVRLVSQSKYTKEYPVHRMICSAFHGGDHPDMVPDHLNAKPSDNRAKNLEWVTNDENLRRAKNTCRSAKLRLDQVMQVSKMLQDGKTIPEINNVICAETGIDDGRYYRAINDIAKRKTHKGVTQIYDWDPNEVTLKVYKEKHIKTFAMLVVHHRNSLTISEIADMFPSYDKAKLKATLKKMRQGVLYKKYLDWAKGQDPNMTLRDEEGFIILLPYENLKITIADMKLASGKLPPSQRKHRIKSRSEYKYTEESYKRKTYYERLNQENEKD